MNTSKKFRWTFHPPLIAICFAVTLSAFANTILTTVDENEGVGMYTSLVLNKNGYPAK